MNLQATSQADATADQAVDFTTLQGLIHPDRRVCTERDLYFRLAGPAGLSESTGTIEFAAAGVAQFNTWFNLFNVGKWVRHCALDDLHLALWGTGKFEVSVFYALPDRSWERLATEVVTLRPAQPTRIELSHFSEVSARKGVIYFEMKALRSGSLRQAAWQTRLAPRRRPDLLVSITTFRREAVVRRTARRFETFIAGSPLKDAIQLVVVDNGQSADIPASDHVTPIPNENLGGSGGFARGLLEARRRGASHCLFMDDDAGIHMESLERTWQFLAYALDPATAVAGAMTIAAHRWAIWENGALFDTRCIPLHMGTDLRDWKQLFAMELETTGPKPRNFYAGWWYFAFPVTAATHMPFPFFVRGDDVSFGLVHDFDTVTLNGVTSFQEADFTDKESLQTLYLDLRSHLAHHLAIAHMDIGRLRTLKIPLWFALRAFIRMHYDTMAALNLAFEDAMRGPAFFANNADMAGRRADLAALTTNERWQPLAALPPEKRRFDPNKRRTRFFLKLTLNGHLLPFFKLFGNHIVLSGPERTSVRPAWGAARITNLDGDRSNGYTVVHSKRRALKESLRLAGNSLRFLRDYDRIKADWRKGYEELTTGTFWQGRINGNEAPKEGPRQ